MEMSRLLLEALAKEHIETESATRVGRMTSEKIKGFIKEFRYCISRSCFSKQERFACSLFQVA